MCALWGPYPSPRVASFVLANQEEKTIPRGFMVLILKEGVVSWIRSPVDRTRAHLGRRRASPLSPLILRPG